MEGIDKIAARISEDAQQEIAQIEALTEEKVAAIGEEFQAKADKEQEDMITRGKKAAAERSERLKSAAQMETRKLALAAKQEVVAEAFDLALEKLCNLPEREYVAFLTKMALEATSTGKEQLIFSQKDRSRIGKQVVVAANEAMVDQVAPVLPDSITETKMGAFLGKMVSSATAQITHTGLLTLSEKTRPIKGGFIMVNGNVEINCAFETLVRLQREKMELQVANALFQ